MNSDRSKLKQIETEQQQNTHSTETQSSEKVFNGVEEILRYDSDQNPVPASVAERLNESLTKEPKPEVSWWKKMLKT
jgi:hypothetical protein